MSYDIIITYTKSAESPANAFSTIPKFSASQLGITQEQIDNVLQSYPLLDYEIRTVDNLLIIQLSYASKEVMDNRLATPEMILFLQATSEWMTANHITRTVREV